MAKLGSAPDSHGKLASNSDIPQKSEMGDMCKEVAIANAYTVASQNVCNKRNKCSVLNI